MGKKHTERAASPLGGKEPLPTARVKFPLYDIILFFFLTSLAINFGIGLNPLASGTSKAELIDCKC